MMTDYRPIACDAYSVLELLAMRRAPVTVRLDGAGALQVLVGDVVDLRTRDAAEFLVLQTECGEALVRLDRIREISEGAQRLFP
jgi:transcriptional antiterminator Rof (Rho-off)